MTRVLACIFFAAASAGAQDLFASETWTELFGASELTAAAGNGGLTASVDSFGRIAVCRWPSPGHFDHVTSHVLENESGRGLGGACWAVRFDDSTFWLKGPPWKPARQLSNVDAPIIETVLELEGTPAQTTQTIFVHADKDLLVCRMKALYTSSAPEVFWYANFSPRTRLIPGVPVNDLSLAPGGFVTFEDGGAIYHARPERVGSAHWEDTKKWVEGNGPEPRWFTRDSGVWIGYAASTEVDIAACGDGAGADSLSSQIDRGELRHGGAKVGQAAGAMRIAAEPDGQGYAATVYVAFGEDRRTVDDTLRYARDVGYERLAVETRERWRARVNELTRPDTTDSTVQQLYRQAVLQLWICTDRTTGAIVRAPVSRPPMGIDLTRDGMWTTLALNMVNAQESAGRHLDFYMRAIKQGALLAALHADGEAALPSFVRDAESSAWWLWSVWQHDAFLREEARGEFRSSVWPSVEAVADYLVNWTAPLQTASVFTFDPASLSDAPSLSFVIAAYSGLKSASAMALAMGHDRPEWANRKSELEDYLVYRVFDADLRWKLEDPLSLWPSEFVGAGDPRWDGVVRGALARIESLPPDSGLELLANVAMLLRDQPDKLRELAPLVAPTVQRAIGHRVPDSLRAAQAIASILATFSHEALREVSR